MSEQLELFEEYENKFNKKLWISISSKVRNEVINILAQMSKSAIEAGRIRDCNNIKEIENE